MQVSTDTCIFIQVGRGWCFGGPRLRGLEVLSPKFFPVHPDVHDLTLSVLYQDEAIVVVNKPSGMLVHRTEGARDPVVVMTFVRDLSGAHVYPVHRLDRATSGAVQIADERQDHDG